MLIALWVVSPELIATICPLRRIPSSGTAPNARRFPEYMEGGLVFAVFVLAALYYQKFRAAKLLGIRTSELPNQRTERRN
jgi:hypothetical protein